MRRFSKIPGVFQNANNGLFGGKMIKINGTWGCLLLILLWPLLILVLLGTGFFFFLSSLFRRPRHLRPPDQSRSNQGQGDIIDVEVIRVDEDIPGIKTITIDPENEKEQGK